MYENVLAYLSANGVEDASKFLLSDTDGVFVIEKWDYEIKEPSILELNKLDTKPIFDKQKAFKEIARLESLMTPRRIREALVGIEEIVGADGKPVKNGESGIPYNSWVQSKIDEQVAIIKT